MKRLLLAAFALAVATMASANSIPHEAQPSFEGYEVMAPSSAPLDPFGAFDQKVPKGRRFAPQGYFHGEPWKMVVLAQRNPEIKRCYDAKFGIGWEKTIRPVAGTARVIPAGSWVTGNYMLDAKGRLYMGTTLQKKQDTSYLMENPATGQKSPVKSCGQPHDWTPPKDNDFIILETDERDEVNVDVDLKVEVNVDANSTSQATATGGNAVAQIYAPQATYVPQLRWIASVTRETYEVASIQWQPQMKINNANWQTMSQQQQQEQQQFQQQMQEQMQQMQQQQQMLQQQLLELIEQMNGGGQRLAFLVPDSSGTIHLAPYLDSGYALAA